MNPKFLNFIREIDGKPTAVVVLTDYWDEVRKHWNNETADQYIDYYEKIILPHFAQRPIAEFANQQTFQEIMEKIESNGTISDPKSGSYSPATLKKFRHLIRTILKVGAKHGVCLDVLWGTDFSVPEDEDPDEEEAHAHTRLRKSLMPNEAYAFADLVFVDPLQEGERMFALLSFALGGRPQEIADLRWGDIVLLNPAKNRYGIAVLTTVHGKGSKPGGKTPNMYRFIPISKRLYKFLMKRKAAVEQAICEAHNAENYSEAIDPIEELFICCAGNNYFRRCSLQHASNVCRDLLRQIGIKESLMRFFEKEAAKSNDVSVWGNEKLVTTYILRRHFCTLLYALGLTEAEILYLMGHSMDNCIEKRSDYRYSAFMDSICDKLEMRPIMNPFPDWDADAFLINDQDVSATHINVPQKNIKFNNTMSGGTLTITITPNEANDPIYIDFGAYASDDMPASIIGNYETTIAHGDQRKNVSVIADLLRMYEETARRIGAKSAFIKKYELAAEPVETVDSE